MRKLQFQTGNYYHIYNRGVDKRDIFCDDKDFIRFVVGMREFNRVETIESLYRYNFLQKEAKLPIGSLASDKLVEIICYSLLPNHFHFLLKQISDKGVEKFCHKLFQVIRNTLILSIKELVRYSKELIKQNMLIKMDIY